MTSQITTSLATYKILDAIDDVKKLTENVMDYYVEMVSVSTNGSITYKYRVYVNYINGIKIVGDLYTYDAETNKFGSLITTPQIPGVILSHGKLYAINGIPYYAEIKKSGSNYIHRVVRLINDYSENALCVVYNVINHTNYLVESFYYYPIFHKLEKTEIFIEPTYLDLTTSAYITGLYIDENGKMANGVFYLELVPYAPSEKQLCYKMTPKPTTSEGGEEPAEPAT